MAFLSAQSLSSISLGVVVRACDPTFKWWRLRDPGEFKGFLGAREFEAILGYMRPSLEKKKNTDLYHILKKKCSKGFKKYCNGYIFSVSVPLFFFLLF